MNHAKLMEQRAQALGGESPRARGKSKDLKALEWVWRWDWSSPKIVDQVASPTRRGVARRLIERGLLKEQPTGSGGAKGTAATVVALTPEGRIIVESEIENPEQLSEYPGFRTYRPMQMRHDLLVQGAVAKWLFEGVFIHYQAPSEIAEQSLQGTKHPDAIVIDDEGNRIALELELTAKKARGMDAFAWGLVKALREEQFDQVIVFSPSRAILKCYQQRFQPGAQVKFWTKDLRGRAIPQGVREMPGWVEACILFLEIEV
ncbi:MULTISPECIES: hypothetical protein [Halomonadaceae]|uniref:Uncharacterized protein n=1 Tax=Vreelandella halophila TaxID=86177 RepID=A0A9X4YFN3_9GAMM|nr:MULTISPECIES: hypothetical protein [Halomonas]MYL28148.1 hypothetical protein [Halomonas utahensis]MYL76055.1 hypothetical protein [Halomonas sp. 22501_18_FS]